MSSSNELIIHLHDGTELLHASGILHRKQTLNKDAEDFIIEEAVALSRTGEIHIKVYLTSAGMVQQEKIASAIKRHFCYRKEQSQKKLKRAMQYGWRTLFIAVVLLIVLFAVTEVALLFFPDNRIADFIRESFIILGWVALWRPIDLLLYDRYPIKRDIRLFQRLEQSNVQVLIASEQKSQ
jgi:hypothetical protein